LYSVNSSSANAGCGFRRKGADATTAAEEAVRNFRLDAESLVSGNTLRCGIFQPGEYESTAMKQRSRKNIPGSILLELYGQCGCMH